MKKEQNNKILFFIPETNISEAFKGEVDITKKTFPKDLGEVHPFDFKLCERVYKEHGLSKAAVDKHLDFIISSDFYVESKNKKILTFLNDIIKRTDFVETLKQLIQEGLIKGNGFLEISLSDLKFKVINANSMYLLRDKTGIVIGYNQYVGEFDKFSKTQVIPFNPDEIAHLTFDKVGDSGYGYGLIYSALKTIDYQTRAERDKHIMMSRKANSPLHVKIGTPEQPATQADIDAFGAKLEYLSNVQEYASDHRVDMKVIDFGNIGDKFALIDEYDRDMLFYIFQVPSVLMGTGSVPEGLAKVQIDAFERRIKSLQYNISQLIKRQIFNPLLKQNGLAGDFEIVWGHPSEGSINERISKVTTILQNGLLGPETRFILEKELLHSLGYDEEADKLEQPPKDNTVEKEAEKKLNQPEIPGEKEILDTKIIEEAWSFENDVTLKEYINLTEIPGFNYIDYTEKVLNVLKVDKFEDLVAKNEEDVKNGLLSEKQVNKLKNILTDGFENNRQLIYIENRIKNELKLKDRITDTNVLSKSDRPSIIARTETVRLSNQGLVELYKENDIKEVRWLTSVSERTCPICQEMNGKVFKINELALGESQPPKHVNCRCSLISV